MLGNFHFWGQKVSWNQAFHRLCVCQRTRWMPADGPVDAGECLRRTIADATSRKKWPRMHYRQLRKYKVTESNPPCGCPMECMVLDIVGGKGFSAVSFLSSVTPSEKFCSSHLRLLYLFPNLALPRVKSPSGPSTTIILTMCKRRCIANKGDITQVVTRIPLQYFNSKRTQTNIRAVYTKWNNAGKELLSGL